MKELNSNSIILQYNFISIYFLVGLKPPPIETFSYKYITEHVIMIISIENIYVFIKDIYIVILYELLKSVLLLGMLCADCGFCL